MRDRFPGEESAGIYLPIHRKPRICFLTIIHSCQYRCVPFLHVPFYQQISPRSNPLGVEPFRCFQLVGFYVETESALVSHGDY